MTRPSNNRKPVLLALASSFLLTVLIVVGSRNLEHYDAALFGYTIASVVAFGVFGWVHFKLEGELGIALTSSASH